MLRADTPTHQISLLRLCVATAGFILVSLLVSACRSESGAAGSGDETGQLKMKVAELAVRQEALAAEYSLARNSDPYLVVDLPGRSIVLRARGRTLREFAMADAEDPPGPLARSSVWTLVEREPLEQSDRPKIKPGQGEEASAEAAKMSLWGPHRMPADYDLVCDGGRVLQIRSLPSQQSGSSIGRWIRTRYRRAAERVRRLGGAWGARSEFRLRLWLAENDSTLLFWSLPKKLSILMVNGVSLPPAPPAIPRQQEAGR
jgi:hypothetical protein